ncbi:MAG TPA: dihydropteroate synthase, partial [Myxococcales bacterium]|nr:dihydropteroate synthase [Myxococcales bacterium]
MLRLLELQGESDSVAACAGIGRSVPDPNLRGWAALLPPELRTLHEGLRQSGLAVLRGERGALALGSISQLWSAARSLADALEEGGARSAAADLARRAGHVEAVRPPWRLPRSRLPEGRVLVMGVLNVTPDSFSDGGRHAAPQAAIEHGLRLAAEGADLIDV